MKHSQLPWIYNGNEIVSESNLQKGIAGATTEDDICFIVEACNNYERVLEENKKLKEALIEVICFTNKNGDETFIDKYNSLLDD